MDVQNKYWQDLVQTKFETYYLDEYLSESYFIDNTINILMAVVSSTSIAAWSIWRTYSYIWAVAIAASQVINAIKIYLPFNKRTKYINHFSNRMSELYNKYDYNWLKVSNGSLTAEEINELVHKLRKESQEISNKFLTENHLPKRARFTNKADARLRLFFDKYL